MYLFLFYVIIIKIWYLKIVELLVPLVTEYVLSVIKIYSYLFIPVKKNETKAISTYKF